MVVHNRCFFLCFFFFFVLFFFFFFVFFFFFFFFVALALPLGLRLIYQKLYFKKSIYTKAKLGMLRQVDMDPD